MHNYSREDSIKIVQLLILFKFDKIDFFLNHKYILYFTKNTFCIQISPSESNFVNMKRWILWHILNPFRQICEKKKASLAYWCKKYFFFKFKISLFFLYGLNHRSLARLFTITYIDFCWFWQNLLLFSKFSFFEIPWNKILQFRDADKLKTISLDRNARVDYVSYPYLF